MAIKTAVSVVQDESIDYCSVFSNWSTLKSGEKGPVLENLVKSTQSISEIGLLLKAMLDSGYLTAPSHNNREAKALSKCVDHLGWVHYAKRIRYLEEEAESLHESEEEKKFNVAELKVYYEPIKADLLKLAAQLSTQKQDPKQTIQLVYAAFTLGYNAGLGHLSKEHYGIFDSESEYEDVYNLEHQDKKYKPAVQQAKSLFDARTGKVKELIQLGLMTENLESCFEQQGFETSICTEGFSYLMCMPYAERIQAVDCSDPIESTEQIFGVLYDAVMFGFHLCVKEKVEKQLRIHSEASTVDVTKYNMYHKI